MKKKLTLTIDADLLPSAKRYARSRGKSLSQVVEDALRDMSEPPGKSFTERWRGEFRLAERDDERYRHLAKKYDL